jgi:hypothetical protein
MAPLVLSNYNLTLEHLFRKSPYMKEYRLYRTDGARTLIGTIAHPTTSYAFTVAVPDGSAGRLTFVLVAVDINNNVSPDSATASYQYNLVPPPDTTPPTPPTGLRIVK